MAVVERFSCGHGQALGAEVHLFQQRGMVKSGNRFESQYEQSNFGKVLLVSVYTVPGSKKSNVHDREN